MYVAGLGRSGPKKRSLSRTTPPGSSGTTTLRATSGYVNRSVCPVWGRQQPERGWELWQSARPAFRVRHRDPYPGPQVHGGAGGGANAQCGVEQRVRCSRRRNR